MLPHFPFSCKNNGWLSTLFFQFSVFHLILGAYVDWSVLHTPKFLLHWQIIKHYVQCQSIFTRFSSSSSSAVWKLGTRDNDQVWSWKRYLCYGWYIFSHVIPHSFSDSFICYANSTYWIQCHHGVRSLQVARWLQTQVNPLLYILVLGSHIVRFHFLFLESTPILFCWLLMF